MIRFINIFFIALSLTACTTIDRQNAAHEKPFVIAANPLAASAGMHVLERGGSAVDAAIAVQATLSLVEPQSSGMGGGTFLHYFDARSGQLTIFDGREVAPAAADSKLFLDEQGQPLNFRDAVVSGRATGVPGAVAALFDAHETYGRLPWHDLFGDAIHTAREGFVISPRLGRFLTRSYPQLSQPDAAAYFSDAEGRRLGTGDRLVNNAYADFLERLAAEGPDALYKGQTAQRIVDKSHEGPLAGKMTLADLANYRAIRRQPICTWYDQMRICAPPPPSSGVAILELFELLERTAISELGPDDERSWYLFAEASRLIYADRDHYVGDVNTVPVAGLLDDDYLDRRAALIGARAAEIVTAGSPPGANVQGDDATHEPDGTSHFVIRDAAGNVVSMTTTVESIFGTGRMVDGFFLNNQLTDFSFSPEDASGNPVPNAVAPGKRPRSSMVPLILFDSQGRFRGAIGSAGGSAILAYVGKSLIAAMDWGLPMQQAIALPNLVARDNPAGAEVDRFDPNVVASLEARGIRLVPGQGEDSGVHGVMIREDGSIDGGVDPRREGIVLIGQ